MPAVVRDQDRWNVPPAVQDTDDGDFLCCRHKEDHIVAVGAGTYAVARFRPKPVAGRVGGDALALAAQFANEADGRPGLSVAM